MNISSFMSRSNALPISLSAAAVLLAWGCSSSPPPRVPAALSNVVVTSSAPRPIFAGRSIANASRLDNIRGRLPVLGITEFDAEFETTYNSIDPERSLFVHDCNIANWCGDYPFADWLNRAAKIVNAGNAAAVTNAWTASFQALLRKQKQQPLPDIATLQLQAVVNRLDLMDPPAANAPELHLVYAPPDGSNFRLILEFAISSPDINTLAGNWKNLASAPDFRSGLTSLIQSLTFSKASLRLNYQLSAGGALPWNLAEWDFTPNADLTQTSPLTQQVKPNCLGPLPNGLPKGCEAYQALWNGFPTSCKTTLFPWACPLDPALFAPVADYGTGGQDDTRRSMDIPGGLTNPSAAARDTLAIQQCIYCHAAETHNNFTHLTTRGADNVAHLSCFLAGNSQTVRPTFAQLTQGDPATCTVNLTFSAPAGVNCDGVALTTPCAAGAIVETRTYHELARRALFMAAELLTFDKTRHPGERKKFDAFKDAIRQNFAAGKPH